MQSAIINGITGTVFQPYFTCPEPATNCVWPDFSTLGICADSHNVTDTANVTCRDTEVGFNCTVTVAEMMAPEKGIEMTWDLSSGTLFWSNFFPKESVESFGSFIAVVSKNEKVPEVTKQGTILPAIEIFHSEFSWCVQRYHNVTASPARLIPTSPTTEVLGISDANFRFSVENLEISDTYQILDAENALSAPCITLKANSTDEHFTISFVAAIAVPEFLGQLLTTVVYETGFYSEDFTDVDVGRALYDSDIQGVMRNVAESMSNLIRSRDPGDNYNATVVYGQATFEEPYITVRWAWMALPLAETLLTAVLLTATIIITRSQPLLRNSAIAYLTTDVEGWSAGESDRPLRPHSEKELEALAADVSVQLDVDDRNRLRFKKVDVDMR